MDGSQTGERKRITEEWGWWIAYTSTAKVTITINGETDAPPKIDIPDSDGNDTAADNSVVEGTVDTVSDVIKIGAEAGVDTVTVGGKDITKATSSDPVIITTSNGQLEITGYDATNGQIAYSYTDDGTAKDHSAGDDSVVDQFEIKVTDIAGVSTTGTLDIQLIDTAPKAVDDTNSITEDAVPNTVSDNVMDSSDADESDELGADDTDVTGVVAGTQIEPVSGHVGQSVSGDYGEISIDANGDYTYTLDNGNSDVQALDDGETLTDTFTYTIKDADGDASTAQITITINGQDDEGPAINIPDSDGGDTSADNSVVEASGKTVGDTITVTAEAGVDGVTVEGQDVTGATPSDPITMTTSCGTLKITGYDKNTGEITYEYTDNGQPKDHSAGDDSVVDQFEIKVTDIAGVSTTGTLDIQLIDTAPEAVDDTNSITEDASPNTVSDNVINGSHADEHDSLGADDTDVTGIAAGIQTGSVDGNVGDSVEGDYGSVTINSNGSYTYELDNSNSAVQALGVNDSLTDTFTYTLTDDDGDTSTAQLTITINGTNDQPVANDDTNTTDQDTTTSGDLVDNDHDPDDSDELTVETVTVDGDETPVAPNDPVVVEGSGGGQFTIHPDGSYDFDPNGDFDDLGDGEQRQTTIEYTITDGNGGTDTAELTVTVDGVNDTPVTTGSNIPDQGGQDGEPVDPVDVTGAFEDPDDSDELTYTAEHLPPGLSITPEGEITGTPDHDASQGGADGDGTYEVTITAEDPHGETTTTTFTWTVDNPPPEASDDIDTTDEKTTVSGNVITGDSANEGSNGQDVDGGNDSDELHVSEADGQTVPDGDSVTVSGSNGGSFTIHADGTYDFDPGDDFIDLAEGESRTTTVEYTVDDGNGGTDTAELTVTVDGVNDTPVTTGSNIPNQGGQDGDRVDPVDVTGAFEDPDDSDELTYTADNLPPGLSITPDGKITGTPDHDASQGGPDDNGTYEVTITAHDPHGETTKTTFTWTVDNPPPEAGGDTDSTNPDKPVSGNVITGESTHDGVNGQDVDGGNDSDELHVSQAGGDNVPDGGSVTVTGDNGGQFVIHSDGSYDFDPAGDFDDVPPGRSTTTTITYTVSDGNGGTDTAELTITVEAPQTFIPPDPGSNDQPQPPEPPAEPTFPSLPGVQPEPTGESTMAQPLTTNGFGDLRIVDFEFTEPQHADLNDLDMGTVVYQATQTDGSPLPGTLAIDSGSGQFSGRLPDGMERAKVTVIAVDDDGDTRTREVWVDANGNVIDAADAGSDAGRSHTNLSDTDAYRNTRMVIGADGAARVLSDNVAGNHMEASVSLSGSRLSVDVADPKGAAVAGYSARLADGSPLPAGLSINPHTGHISGAWPAGVDALDIRITAQDSDGSARVLDLQLQQGGQQAANAWQPLVDEATRALADAGDASVSSHGQQLADLFAEPEPA